MERSVRVLVIAVLAPLAIAGVAAQVLLSHRSGTYIALVAYLVTIGAVAGLVYQKPRPRMLALWALVAWFATILHRLLGDPDMTATTHSLSWLVAVPLAVTVPVMLLGVPLLALMYAGPGDASAPTFVARIRRVTGLACVLAIAGAIAFSVPGRNESSVLGVVICLYALVVLMPAFHVYRDPQRWNALVWALWTSPFAALGYLAAGEDLLDQWQLGAALLGTMHALLLVALPLVCLLTRDRRNVIPSARVQ